MSIHVLLYKLTCINDMFRLLDVHFVDYYYIILHDHG